MVGLIILVVLVMVSGLIATLIIGRSQSNKEENPRYSQQTGRKWLRLGGLYVVGIVAVVVILVVVNR
jgi:ABC-type Fe3+ transport system permease subunit